MSAHRRLLGALLALAAMAAAAGPARAQGSLPDPALIEAARQAGAGAPRTGDPSLQRPAAPLTGRVDPKRYRVGPGDVFRIRRNGLTVVSAFKPSMLVVTPFEPEQRAMRVSMTTRGAPEPVALFTTGRKPATSWMERFWTRLFVASSCPTTAAL